jgi:hypothetical protein
MLTLRRIPTSHIYFSIGRSSASEIYTQYCWPFLSFVKIGAGKEALLLWMTMKSENYTKRTFFFKFSWHIIRVIMWRMEGEGHVACRGETPRVLVKNPARKRPVGRPRPSWMWYWCGSMGVVCIHLAQVRINLPSDANIVKVFLNMGMFLNIWGAVSFWRMSHLHGITYSATLLNISLNISSLSLSLSLSVCLQKVYIIHIMYFWRKCFV